MTTDREAFIAEIKRQHRDIEDHGDGTVTMIAGCTPRSSSFVLNVDDLISSVVPVAHAREAGAQEPVAFMYERDGYVYTVFDRPPIVPAANRWSESARAEPWTETPLYTHPAPAQEPVAVPARDKMVADLISIADASRRVDGSDIPLGETLRKAATMLAAPVAPPAESGEPVPPADVYQPKQIWYDNTSMCLSFGSEKSEEGQCRYIRADLASHTPTPQPGGAVKNLDGSLVDKVAGILTGYIAANCCHRTGGDGGGEPKCDCRDASRTILSALEPSPAQASAVKVIYSVAEPLTFIYRNWRGEVAERRVIPREIHFGATEWHPEPQWLLRAFDMDKGAERDFAMKDISHPSQWNAGAEAMREQIIEYLSWDEDFLDDHDAAIRTMPIPVPPASEG